MFLCESMKKGKKDRDS